MYPVPTSPNFYRPQPEPQQTLLFAPNHQSPQFPHYNNLAQNNNIHNVLVPFANSFQIYPNWNQQAPLVNFNNNIPIQTFPNHNQAVGQWNDAGKASTLAIDHLKRMGLNLNSSPGNDRPRSPQYSESEQCPKSSPLSKNWESPTLNVEDLATVLEKRILTKLSPIHALRSCISKLENNQTYQNNPKMFPPMLRELKSSNTTSSRNDLDYTRNDDSRERDIIGWNSNFRAWQQFGYEPQPLRTSDYKSFWDNEARNTRNYKRLENTEKLRTCLASEYENIRTKKNNESLLGSRNQVTQVTENFFPVGIGSTAWSIPELNSVDHQNLELFQSTSSNVKFRPFRYEEHQVNRFIVGGLKDRLSSNLLRDNNTAHNFPTTRTRKCRTILTRSSQIKNRSGIILTKDKYYCIPGIDELDSKTDDFGQCFIDNFEVGHLDYGRIIFEDKFNVAGINLDEAVQFEHKRVIIYPTCSQIPSPGTELNRPSIITLHNYWPSGKDVNQLKTHKHELRKYEEKLIDQCISCGHEFIYFDNDNGNLTFKIFAWNIN